MFSKKDRFCIADRHCGTTRARRKQRRADARFAQGRAGRRGSTAEQPLQSNRIMKALPSFAALLALLSACANRAFVRDDEMSAAQHRNEAQREETVGSDESREHARQHAAAAQFLEQFEDEACAAVPPSSRAACPLFGPLVRLDDVPGGIRATFADAARVPGAIAEMRCHYAFARARHFDERVSCPLYVSGIEIRRGLDPKSAEIVAHDDKTVRLIRARSREQAVFVRAR